MHLGSLVKVASLLPMQKIEKRFPSEAGVSNQRSQQPAAQFPMPRHGETAAGRPDQDHVATLHAIERESDPGDGLDEIVSRYGGKSRHPLYTRTSMTWNSDEGGEAAPCSRRLVK